MRSKGNCGQDPRETDTEEASRERGPGKTGAGIEENPKCCRKAVKGRTERGH